MIQSGQQVEGGASTSATATEREEESASTSQMEVTQPVALPQDNALTIKTKQNLPVTDETPSTSEASGKP